MATVAVALEHRVEIYAQGQQLLRNYLWPDRRKAIVPGGWEGAESR